MLQGTSYVLCSGLFSNNYFTEPNLKSLSSSTTVSMTEGPDLRSRPTQEVAAEVGCGQDHPEQSQVAKRSPHSLFRI